MAIVLNFCRMEWWYKHDI